MHDIQAHLSCPELTVHFLKNSNIQAFFAAEVVIDHPLTCACTLRNHVNTRAAEPDRRKFLGRHVDRRQEWPASKAGVIPGQNTIGWDTARRTKSRCLWRSQPPRRASPRRACVEVQRVELQARLAGGQKEMVERNKQL